MNTSVAGDKLKAFIERIERLQEEADAINDDKKEVYAEAKGNGFDTTVMKLVVKIRRQDKNERMEQEALLDLYLHALGMVDATRAPAPEGNTTEKGAHLAVVT